MSGSPATASVSGSPATASVLIIEDQGTETDKLLGRLGSNPTRVVQWERVNTLPALREALHRRQDWKLVVSDSRVAAVGVLEAVAMTQELAPRVPVVVLALGQQQLTVADVIKEWVTHGRTTELAGGTRTPEVENPAIPHLDFGQRMLEAQEAERRHLARELHDELGQLLTAVSLNLAVAQRERGQVGASAIATAKSLVGQAMDQVRSFAAELWPTVVDELGLLAALRWLVENQLKAANLKVDLHVAPLPPLSQALTVTCFRLVQESLTNVARHAAAHEVEIRIEAIPGAVSLMIRDDGRGFDVDAVRQRAAQGGAPSFGLVGMRERTRMVGGQLEIHSRPGQGTTIAARIPIPPADAHR